jgi:hypothetical protein
MTRDTAQNNPYFYTQLSKEKPVDLSLGVEGVLHLRGGERFFCPVIDPYGEHFSVRYEHGWYCRYRRNGERISAGLIIHSDGTETIVVGNNRRDVICFEPMSSIEAQQKYPGIAGEICP